MQAINQMTMSVLEQFRKKASELPWEAHPYATALEGRKRLGLNEWTDEHREDATAAMALWVGMITANSVTGSLNEIVALMNIAAGTGEEEHKKAAENMASSMQFVEHVFKSFLHAVDFQHIAEQLFADGERLEKERNEEFAAAEAAKAKVAKQKTAAPTPQPLSGTVHRRWEPSQN